MEVNFRRKMSALAAIFGMLLLLSVPLLAQTTLGRISGVVTDPSGAVVPNAKITATNEETKQEVSTTSSGSGSYTFPQIPAGVYTVKVEAAGMKVASFTAVKVDIGREYSLNAKLELGTSAETVEVVAGAELVNTSTSEITNTVTMAQVRELPLRSRDPISLVRAQVGVPAIFDKANAAINGGRPGWTSVTQDGINIQDNFIRVNGLDFVPNRPTSDNVGEFSITSNNQGADSAGGSSQVKFKTDAGGNAFHGSVYEFNRNSFFGANSYRNKNVIAPVTVLPKPFLNRNQFGGRLSGPFIKNKLFFFGYYENYREAAQRNSTKTIPRNDDLLAGVFRYTAGGVDRVVNVVSLAGLTPGTVTPRTVNSVIQSQILAKVAPAANANQTSTNLNTRPYAFSQSDRNIRHFAGGRADYELNANHHFEGTYKWTIETDDRTDIDVVNVAPLAFTQSEVRFFVGAWRWTINPRMQNELRMGGNQAPADFRTKENFGSNIIGGVALISDPVVTFMPQGRNTRTYNYIDNFSWVRANHSMAFGGQFQNVRITPYNFQGGSGPLPVPQVNLGYTSTDPNASQEILTAANFPAGIDQTNLANANALRAFLTGWVTSAQQSFDVTSKTSGFVSGVPNIRDFTLNNFSFYAKDDWRILPNLTLNYGLKWDFWSPLREDNNLLLLPVLTGTIDQTVLNPAATVDFAKGDLYEKDLNNFSPSFGFAWDPFRNGKTSVRGGYTLVFVNDEIATSVRNAANNNQGLSSGNVVGSLFQPLAATPPAVPAPAFVTPPRTLAQQMAIANSAAAIFGVASDFATPYIHQLNFGIQRELPGDMSAEVRYVGTLGKKLIRGYDLNQQTGTLDNALVAELNLARQNTFACSALYSTTAGACPVNATSLPILAGSSFNGTGNALVPVAQRANTTLRNALQQNAYGAFIDSMLNSTANRTTFPNALRFLPNSSIYIADVLGNGGTSTYHGLQTTLRRRMKNGLFGEVNYAWSKTTANVAGNSQARLETLLDNNRPQLELRVSDFHVAHVINGSAIYELPFGRGKRWANANNLLDKVVGGWQMSGVFGWQSGAPFSILSARGSFNRAGRSGLNRASSNLNRHEIQNLLGVYRGTGQPGGGTLGVLYWINPQVLCPTGGVGCSAGAAVGSDNLANTPATSFDQVFFNPKGGDVGNLGINAFTGPSQFNVDLGLSKKTKITERVNVEFRSEFFNLTNHTNWFMADINNNINSTAFGQINPSNVNVAARVLQFALKLNF
ncbi:MAG TPA: TonB-dependent receptor [Terriglobales bacterium]|nr:TonB-dependent receptor [Terriglobales bacterium]